MKSQCCITTKGILTFTEAIFNKKIPIESTLYLNITYVKKYQANVVLPSNGYFREVCDSKEENC